MNERLKKYLSDAKAIHAEAMAKAKAGSFAHKLSAESFADHLAELQQIGVVEDDRPIFELIDFRLKASALNSGSVPLGLISKAAEHIRTMIGYAALKLIQGGINRKRIPNDLYETLDLRLAGILPGSSRLIVVATADRDLLGDGLAKNALERIFSVLETQGNGPEFLEAITDLGPSSAKRLREFLKLLKYYSAEAEFSWKYSGEPVKYWNGTKEIIDSVASALEVTEIKEQARIDLSGKIELLSKRERIALRTQDGKLTRILYPKILLTEVSTLHLDQEVTLLCQVTETENPLTNESSIFYELLEIKGSSLSGSSG